MFKYFIFIAFGIFWLDLNSQNISGEVYYKQTVNFTRPPYSANYKMTFNHNSSLYKEIDIKRTKDLSITSGTTQGLNEDIIKGRKNITPEYYYNDHESFYFKDIFYDRALVVKEASLQWKWKLSNETKKLGDFNCKKATARFRGRNYIVWYSTDIPVPYGPWKFKDLPGLILEIYDSAKEFYISAYKVRLNTKSKVIFDKKELNKAMTLSQYQKKKIKIIKTHFAELSSKLPKGTPSIKFDENCSDCIYAIEYFNKH